MKPLRIEIHNLGAIPYANIDLTNTTLAAICGVNGAGKSTAFTVAPRFALYGATKPGTSIDDMIRTGATEAAVNFYFDHQGGTYRVIRTRSKKGKGKTTLELQKAKNTLLLDGSLDWESLSGASISETQKKIIDLLGLDDETFVASSMILQGDSGNFTKRPAGQRKAILSQVLQLDQYETLQDKAKAKAGEVNLTLEKSKAKVADIDTRLAEKPILESDKLAAEVKLAKTETDIQSLEENVQTLQVAYSALVAKIQQAEDINRQAKEKWADVGSKTSERDRQQGRMDNAQKLLDREADILTKVAAYDTTKDTVTALRVKRDQQAALKNEADRLKNEQLTVEAGLAKVIADINRIAGQIADRPRLEAAKAEYDTAVARLPECQKELEEDKRLLSAVKDCQDKLFQTEDRYIGQEQIHKQNIESLEANTAMLADANCVDLDNAQCKFLANAIKDKDKLVNAREQYSVWKVRADQEISDLQTAVKAAKNKRAEYWAAANINPLEPHELQEKINQLKTDVELLAKLAAMEPLLDNLKLQRTDLETRQADINVRLENMRNQYRELSDGLKELPAMEIKLTELEPWLRSKEQLPAAKEIANTARETIDRLKTEINDLTIQVVNLETEYKTLMGDSETLKQDAEKRLKEAQDSLKQCRDEHLSLTGRLGGIRAKLVLMEDDEKTRQSLMGEMEPLAKELVRWQTLVKAFGKDGIPALIIENAVPELERIANDILGQMSGGKNYLRFETQRELKSGKGMTETLDIIVGDWAGERIYETFSGGEQLRIDFAIRFALAELLARRAGSKIDWIVVDEGIGSQDAHHRELVLQAIKGVSDRFSMILVITHIEEAQKFFEQTIHFDVSGEDERIIQVA
ncbi:AAA family ATPase [Sporomusa sp. KB1]|jgi:exonuclease SbcC|uniref:AAA family ATPase n=1 Tax=Sporomusa sp. KB1 TaxID=943346 RepID=UPI0011ABBE85|nr:SMC family ATPase [Sporomusa sp. KB1]TWH48515.1 exonuclease SbcC [Sporomusa sp. KB1]